eukprot:4948214-Pleurochrysis_carterae.AAC.3
MAGDLRPNDVGIVAPYTAQVPSAPAPAMWRECLHSPRFKFIALLSALVLSIRHYLQDQHAHVQARAHAHTRM